MPNPEILFVCTGNYYRSRYAEAYFNHQAAANGLDWRAFSRGLYPGWVDESAGDLSPHTIAAMKKRGIAPELTGAQRTELTEADFARARHVVALKATEHRPMMAERFPEKLNQVEYWEVHDIDYVDPKVALPEIETHIDKLLNELKKLPDGNFLSDRLS